MKKNPKMKFKDVLKTAKKTYKSGGGSDWVSTVYSRGPSSTPNQPEAEFRSFTKSAEYISNKDLTTKRGPYSGTKGNSSVTEIGDNGSNSGVATRKFK